MFHVSVSFIFFYGIHIFLTGVLSLRNLQSARLKFVILICNLISGDVINKNLNFVLKSWLCQERGTKRESGSSPLPKLNLDMLQ